MQSPMAAVVLGGLPTAVVLNMLVVPVLSLRYGVDRPGAAVLPRRAGSRCWKVWGECGRSA